jgi:hypothetical protein
VFTYLSVYPFKAPTVKDVDRFQQALIEQNIFVRLRSPKGAGIRAACGQLEGDRCLELVSGSWFLVHGFFKVLDQRIDQGFK